MPLPDTTDNTTPWGVREDADRPTRIPDNLNMSRDEGRKILGMSETEFGELFARCQEGVREHLIKDPPTKYTLYGQLVENQGSLVLPLEAAYPALRRCSQNWGAKWVLKKAKHAVNRKAGTEQRKLAAHPQGGTTTHGVQAAEPQLKLEIFLSAAGVESEDIGNESWSSNSGLLTVLAVGLPGTQPGNYVGGTGHVEDMLKLAVVGQCASVSGAHDDVQAECLEPGFQGAPAVETGPFKESITWLASGQPRYGREVKK